MLFRTNKLKLREEADQRVLKDKLRYRNKNKSRRRRRDRNRNKKKDRGRKKGKKSNKEDSLQSEKMKDIAPKGKERRTRSMISGIRIKAKNRISTEVETKIKRSIEINLDQGKRIKKIERGIEMKTTRVREIDLTVAIKRNTAEKTLDDLCILQIQYSLYFTNYKIIRLQLLSNQLSIEGRVSHWVSNSAVADSTIPSITASHGVANSAESITISWSYDFLCYNCLREWSTTNI